METTPRGYELDDVVTILAALLLVWGALVL